MSLQASIHATAHDRYRTSGIWRILYRSGRPAPRGGATSPAWPVPAACGSAGSAASPPSASPSDRRACQQPVKMCTLRPVATGGGYIPSHCCKHSYPTVRQPHPRLDGTSGMRWTFSWRTERCGRPRLFPACYSRPARCCRLPAMPRTGVGAMSGAMSVAGPPWVGATGTGIAVGTATTATRAVARSTSTAAPIATVRAAGPRATGFPGIPPAPIYRRRLARLPPGPPPRGYHWVGVGGDYFLVAPTGIVFNVMIGG